MGGLLSGLGRFGLDSLEGMDLYLNKCYSDDVKI